jgi:hypothetical protein
MQHAGKLDTARPRQRAVKEHVGIGGEGSKTGTKLRPTTAQGWRAREQPGHVAQPRHDPAGGLGIVPGDVVPNCSQILAGLRGNDEPRHILALRFVVQKPREDALALEAFAAIELIDTDGDRVP